MTAADATSGARAPSPFASIGPALLASGFSPIPIRPDGKMPGVYAGGEWHIMRAWSRYCSEFPDPFSIKNWAKWPNANVGVALGKGVVGFDIDREDMVEPILAVLPPAIVAKRGRKGVTAFYQADTAVIRSRGFKIDGFGVMDLIADGKQTVLPPSIHPDTHEPYVWTTERTLADTRPEELTICTPEHFEAVLAVLTEYGWHEEKTYQALPGDRGDADSDNSDVTAFYRKLNDDALGNLAAWVPRLGLSRLVPTGHGYRSVAEWRPSNSGKPLGKRNLLLSIDQKGIKDFGDCEKGYTPINLVMAAHEMADFQRDKAVVWLGELLGYSFAPTMVLNRTPRPPGHVKPQRPSRDAAQPIASAPAKPVQANDDVFPGDLPMPSSLRFPGDAEAATPNVVPIGVAFDESPEVGPFDFAGRSPIRAPTDAEFDAVTYLPGKVGELIDFIDHSNEEGGARPLALAATLAFVGALTGRLYATPSGLRTNIYSIGLAPSGVGKEHARRCIKSIAAKGTLTNFISAGMASGTGLRNRIEAQGSVVYLVDEFHVTMGEWNNPRLPHAAQTKKNVLEYFSAGDTAFYGIDYAGNAGWPCHNPNLCIYATSTPAKFIPACSAGSAEEGLLPRMITFAIRGDGCGEDRIPTADVNQPSPRLISLCRDLTVPKVGGNMMNVRARDTSQPFPAVVARYGPGAEDLYRERKRRYRNLAKLAPADREPFLRRVNEHATKIALILAIGVEADKPIITVELLDLGHRIAELCTAAMLSQIDGRLADNDRQREFLDVKRWIAEAGWAGVTRRALATRVNGRFDDRRLDDILKSLTETTCEVAVVRRPTGGRPVMRYVGVVNLKPEERESGT